MANTKTRVVSGMRPTGSLHLGHHHGVLKNWLELQHKHECFFFVADWHALTTDYEDTHALPTYVRDILIDWLSVGVDPNCCNLFIQSHIPEHAELHLLLSMITPLGWLERIPSYKDTQEKLKTRDLTTYGFLGYPLLQSADIFIYRADWVPVGEDQVSHVEIAREIARRFNFLYGREKGFSQRVALALQKLGEKSLKLENLRNHYLEHGKGEALSHARSLIASFCPPLTGEEVEYLHGYLVDSGKEILLEPRALLTKVPKFPGLDGQKMSKSYGNTIGLREDPKSIEKKIRTMPTDPARRRRTDKGTPEKCPVWPLHQVYSSSQTQTWVQQGCTTAGIGCLDCKKPLIDSILEEQKPILERSKTYLENPRLLNDIIEKGCSIARTEAQTTLSQVKQAMRIAGF